MTSSSLESSGKFESEPTSDSGKETVPASSVEAVAIPEAAAVSDRVEETIPSLFLESSEKFESGVPGRAENAGDAPAANDQTLPHPPLPSITLMPAHLAQVEERVFELDPVDLTDLPSEPEPSVQIEFSPVYEVSPAGSPDLPRGAKSPGPVGELPPPVPPSPPPPSEPVEEEFGPPRSMPPTVEDLEAQAEMDFETYYNLGVSYKEMTLFENAIKELQRAIQKVSPTGDDSRYLNCCSLLGMCYRELRMFRDALDWFRHALDLSRQTEASYLAVLYEIGLTYEMEGHMEAALQAFAEVYAFDVTFRSVAEKVRRMETDLMNRQERIQKIIPIRLRGIDSEGVPIEEHTSVINISRRGAGIKTAICHPVGTVVEVDFLEADRRHLGRVIWCTSTDDRENPYRMGVNFYVDSELGVENWPPPLPED